MLMTSPPIRTLTAIRHVPQAMAVQGMSLLRPTEAGLWQESTPALLRSASQLWVGPKRDLETHMYTT